MNLEPLNLILLNAGHAKHFADWNYNNIRSPFARIYYVTKGSAMVNIENVTYQLNENNLYLIPSFTMHTDRCEGEFSLYYLHIYESVSNATSIFERYQFPFVTESGTIDLMLIERLISINPNRELKKYDPKTYDNNSTLMDTIARNVHTPFSDAIETTGILQQLLSRFLKNAVPRFHSTDKRILNTLIYIANHIDMEIHIRMLSDICCLSPDHYIRLFKKEMKCTPIEYINRKKIEKAQSHLIFTTLSVKDIAFKLSFDNVSYFNRLFKSYTGQTPMSYRQEIWHK